MIRFSIVAITVLAIAGLTLGHLYAAALTSGLIVGSVLMLRGIAAGGNLGNARQFEKKPADMNARIGTCLAAAGIASAALGNSHFPVPFHVFYTACLVLALMGALALAWTGRKG